MTDALVAGLLAGYGIAIPVGAVAAYLVALTARTSLRTGVAAALGVATADGSYALLAVLGGSALGTGIEPYARPLRLLAALVLVVVAVRLAVSSRAVARVPAANPTHAFATLLGITLANPTTVVYFAALVVGARAGPAVTGAEQAVFVLAAFAASASWQVLLAAGGALLGRTLTGRRGRLATTTVSSAVILSLAVRLALAG